MWFQFYSISSWVTLYEVILTTAGPLHSPLPFFLPVGFSQDGFYYYDVNPGGVEPLSKVNSLGPDQYLSYVFYSQPNMELVHFCILWGISMTEFDSCG